MDTQPQKIVLDERVLRLEVAPELQVTVDNGPNGVSSGVRTINVDGKPMAVFFKPPRIVANGNWVICHPKKDVRGLCLIRYLSDDEYDDYLGSAEVKEVKPKDQTVEISLTEKLNADGHKTLVVYLH